MTLDRTSLRDALDHLLRCAAPLEAPAADRVRSDLSAAIFRLSRSASDIPIVCVVGGTGTGKSTIVNRLLGAELTATSFRRTFTAGAVAIAREALPEGFGALVHIEATPPARGQADRITLLRVEQPILRRLTIIDTPDIDGELTEHHAGADRVFRWCDAVVFLVTPEKYQMPELQPYYRLAQRYGLASLFVMNKADEPDVVADYAELLSRSGVANARVLAVARDDATWQPTSEQTLGVEDVAGLAISTTDDALHARVSDVASRVSDQLVTPLAEKRLRIDRTAETLRMLAGDAIELDVHPLTQQLQRRMREKSVLYLMGPQRLIDRVRSVPSMLARLPRSMWSWTRTGEFKLPDVADAPAPESPDFRSIVAEQFQSLQSRIDDLLRDATLANNDVSWKRPIDDAGAIVDEELQSLRTWLETRWNATPRDTAILNKLLKVIPGGQQLTKYSEAAPYLLAIACATHSAMIGHLDLIVLGGYSAVTWLTERLSNEVASRTRATNRAIAERYAKLASAQVDAVIAWLERLAPSKRVLAQVESALERVRACL